MTSERFSVVRFITGTLAAVLVFGGLAAAAVPLLINYQGRLTVPSGSPVPDAEHSFTFSLYSDSAGGSAVWTETRTLPTTSGLFTHLLGSVTALNPVLFLDGRAMFLEVTADGEVITPRTRLASTPFAVTAANLDTRDSLGRKALRTSPERHELAVYDSLGKVAITLRGGTGDSAVVIPGSSVNAREILDEPGIAEMFDFTLVSLGTGDMTDMAVIDITIPANGYIVLHGKCYVLLSGTTGPNTADIQIDKDEGGDALFPYYTRVGLSGYVNTGFNYFPIYVTRIYYEQAGTYTFRMEGRANYPLPAEVKSWDHILTAVYYATGYNGVGYFSAQPIDHPGASPVIINDPLSPERNGTYYRIDLRRLERQSDEMTPETK
jgi:hypothetical protein